MSQYVLCLNPGIYRMGSHDPGAALFRDGEFVFGIEEERLTRQKHAVGTFPEGSIRACLDHADIDLPAVSHVAVPWVPRKFLPRVRVHLGDAVRYPDTPTGKLERAGFGLKEGLRTWLRGGDALRERLAAVGEPVPEVRMRDHHRCHAASAFHPSPFDRALVVTADGYGENVSTTVSLGTRNGLERVRAYDYPNSLGLFFGAVTKFLGYRPNNGEGKVMGLAPYGDYDAEIDGRLRADLDTGVDYDVTAIATGSFEYSTRELERRLGRTRTTTGAEFAGWEADLALAAQSVVEEVLTNVVEHYCSQLHVSQVALAGGVALNCKVNKRIRELDCVETLFVQPVAHDAGTALGAGMLAWEPRDVPAMEEVYRGPAYTDAEVRERLDQARIEYSEPEDRERFVARRLADGDLVGWFQGRTEMGPRALGNRSILADPRTEESRDRVNEFVKHREPWRPFAPSILADRTDEYLVDAAEAPFMIDTFDVHEEARSEIPAVLHPGDGTTRPQTVDPDQNHGYHRLISAFEELTGVPVVLNTSFNDHGEPIVNTPTEAIKAFFGMGLDLLVLNDVVVEK